MMNNIVKDKIMKIKSYAKYMTLYEAFQKQLRTDLGNFRSESEEAWKILTREQRKEEAELFD